MKIECENKKFKIAVSATEKVTNQNLPLPVLGSIVIRAGNGQIILQSTNLEISLEYSVPGKISKEGEFAIPAALLMRFVQNIPDNSNISLELVDGNVNIKTDSTSTIIKTTPIDDFPTFPKINEKEETDNIELDRKVFTDAIKSVSYAASNSEIKPEIASVYVQNNNEGIVFTATDSFRAAEKKVLKKDIESENGDISSFIVPIKNINDIVKVLENLEEKIKIISTGKQLVIKSKEIYLISRLIDGTFPDVSQVFPKNRLTDVVVLKDELLQSLKTINVFSDKFNKVGFKVLPGEKLVEVYARNQDTGESVASVDGTLEGEDVDMKFNARYIMDVFQSLEKDSINLRFNGKDKPMVIRGVGDGSFTYLAMPMNT